MNRKTKIFVYSIFTLLNLIVFIAPFLRKDSYKLPFYITFHSFWANCFYFIICLILEIRTEWKKIYSEKFLPFMQNIYFKYAFTLTSFITVNFYIFAILGENFIKLQTEVVGVILSIFLHGGEYIFLLAEFYFSPHSFIPSYFQDVVFLLLYFSIYFFLCVLAINSNIYAYEFMKITNTQQNIIIYVFSNVLLINFYMIYQYFAFRKNQSITNRESISIQRINFGDNVSNFNSSNDKELTFISDSNMTITKGNTSASTAEKNKDVFSNEKIKRNALTNY